MKKCINLKHPEFQELLSQTNNSILELAADVSTWQEEMDTDDFPSKEELDKYLKKANPTLELNYPLNSKKGISSFKRAVKFSELPDYHKEDLNFLIDENHDKINLKVAPEDIESVTSQLKTFMPENYIDVSDIHVYEGQSLVDIEVINPRVLLKPQESLESLVKKANQQLLTDGEIFESFSTFFSDRDENRGEINEDLENILVKLLELYDIKVERSPAIIDQELDELINSGQLDLQYKNKVWAFAKVMADGTYTGKIHLRPNGYTTEDVFEEAGHIFVYWLQKYNINIEGLNFKLWEQPSQGIDYLALTPEYKGRFNQIYNKYINRVNAEIEKLQEFREERLDPDINQARFDFLNAELQKESNIKLLNYSIEEIQALANKLSRIEIAGQLVGGALEAELRKENYIINIKSKGAAGVIQNWLESLVRWFKNLKAKLFENVEDLDKLWKAVLNRKFLDTLSTIRKEEEGLKKYTDAIQKYAQDINHMSLKGDFEITQDLNFIEVISKNIREDIVQFLDEIPEVLRLQKEGLENEIATLYLPEFIENYFNFIASLKNDKEVVSKLVPNSVWEEIRIMSKEESERALKNFDILEVTDGKSYGFVASLKPILSKVNLGSFTLWDVYTSHIMDVYQSTKLKYPRMSVDQVNQEIKKQIIAINDAIKGGLQTNIIEATRTAVDQPSHYELWQGKYKEYLNRLSSLEGLNLKLQTVNGYIKREQIGKAVHLFLLGQEIQLKDGPYMIPPMFDELNVMLKRINTFNRPLINQAKENLKAAEEVLVEARRKYEYNGSVIGSPEHSNLLAAEQEFNQRKVLLKIGRPDKYQYDLMFMKLQQFKDIALELGATNVDLRNSIMNYFPKNKRKAAEQALMDSVAKIQEIEEFLLEFKIDRILDQVNGTDKTETGKNLKFYKPLEEEIVTDVGAWEELLGAKQNSDKIFASLVSSLSRLSSQAQVAAMDKRIGLSELYEKNIDKLLEHPEIKAALKLTKTGKFQELFHETIKGERTHYLISEWFHDKLAREQKEYMTNIYNQLNEYLEKKGSVLRIPVGDLLHDQQERNKLFKSEKAWELTEDPILLEVRRLYNALKVGYDMTFNQAKPETERNEIIKEKRQTLSPSEFSKWLKASEKIVRPFLTKEEYYYRIQNNIPTYDTIYLGELAVPAYRPNDMTYSLSYKIGEDYVPFELELPAVNFQNDLFKKLYSVPEFKEIYDYMFQMQSEIYRKIQRQNLTNYNRLRLYQSGAFEGHGTDVWSRLKNLEFGEAWKRIKDNIRSFYEINDEDKFVLDKKNPEIPMRGVNPYDSAGRLMDNYFELISTYWQSLDNFDRKHKGLQEWEVMRALLKLRQVSVVDKKQSTVYQQELSPESLINYTKEIENHSSDVSKYWANLIDDWLERDLYEEHTSFPDWVKNNPKRLRIFFLLSKLPGITTALTLWSNIYSASGAKSQSTVGFLNMAYSGRFLQVPGESKPRVLEALAYYGKLYGEDRLNGVLEYFQNRNFTKTSLVQEYFGIIDRTREARDYQTWFTHFMSDIHGYGLMKMGNHRPARMFTKAALQSYKWIPEANMFMTPDVYHRWKATTDIGVTLDQTRESFRTEGESAWDMLEIVNDKIQPKAGHEDKFSINMRAAVHQYLTEGLAELDMKTTDQPKAMRGLGGKFLFSLKGYLVRWGQQLLQNRNNMALNTEELSYLKYFQLAMKSIWDQKTRENFKSQRIRNYDMRDAFGRLLTATATVVIGEQMASFFTHLAIKNCENNNYESWPCWAAAQASYHTKRAISEIGGSFSWTQLMSNLDKPINSWGTFGDNMLRIITIMGFPLEQLLTFWEEDQPDVINSGPYQGMTSQQKALIKVDPFVRNAFEFFNSKAVISRDRLVTDQINKQFLPLVPGLNMPELARTLIVNPVNQMWEYGIDDERFKVEFPERITPKILVNKPK